ncbi:MAG TPA: hypothetical protein ENJ28_04800 [Gammaproteobacteria bacterium]|nr:hypothetical protein [Gammaproteobacteria bacterium]
MPSLADKQTNKDNNLLLRELFYGAPKTRKTWLAGTAAEAGFNVILLDADHGYHILTKQISPEAAKRISVIECRDSLIQPVASQFIARFLKQGRVWFDESQRKVITSKTNINENTIELSLEKHLNSNTVLILDSYTAIVNSLKFAYAKERRIDLTDLSEDDSADMNLKRNGYAVSGGLASFILERITKLPCHVIVIGHATQYEKYTKDQKKLEWSRRVIKSTSNPHSLTIGDKFSDILYFFNASASVTKIETRAEKDAEGGARIIPPNSYQWADLTWDKICALANIPLPPKDLPYLDLTPAVSTTTEVTKPSTIKAAPQKAKLTGLLNKK